MQKTKQDLLEEQNKLKVEGEYVQSEYYLEKVARDELHLTKPGETVVIIPDSVRAGEVVSQQVQDGWDKKENWQKWWEVLSGKD